MLTLKRDCLFPYRVYPDEISEEMSIFQSSEMQRCFFYQFLGVFVAQTHVAMHNIGFE